MQDLRTLNKRQWVLCLHLKHVKTEIKWSIQRIAGRLPRHAAINTIVKMSLARAQIPFALEPVGLCRSDGKRPDGVTITPWQAGRTLVWDITCPDTYAVSHVVLATREAGQWPHQLR